ncbi:hypothetical protein NITMOv2_4794 [Nitrospira moscoviensis]|uniref:Uncharacterized protein n=1 Tax=Nitrospira moscoviensis TaxID=42253 RepID=A0A0K2GKK7_NITMO|nr:hypothetical protein NITMOv2_4794 [Nitrospira moscoviensis]
MLESQTPGRNARDEDNSRLLQERWGDRWWLSDEDLHYHADGFKLVGGPQDVFRCLSYLVNREAFRDEIAAMLHERRATRISTDEIRFTRYEIRKT